MVQPTDHYDTGALPSRNFAFSFSLFALQRAGFSMGCSCGKNNFSGSKKNIFFPHCPPETQTSPAFQKTIFQALKNIFFACLVSNLPTPPRYLV